MSTLWAAGRYEAVAEQIARIAQTVVDTVDQRSPVRDRAVVDLACGTGSAALAAARKGARVTGVDITPELVAIGQRRAREEGLEVDWRTGDAAATGLADSAFDAAVSNMGVIFVEPVSQVAELERLLKPGAVLGFSSWVRDAVNPFFDPILAVLGAPPARGFSPDQWGDQSLAAQRLSAGFVDVEFSPGTLTWRFGTQADALRFVTQESPMHVDILRRVEGAERDALVSAFDDALRAQTQADGHVAFDASYVVVTAVRR